MVSPLLVTSAVALSIEQHATSCAKLEVAALMTPWLARQEQIVMFTNLVASLPGAAWCDMGMDGELPARILAASLCSPHSIHSAAHAW